MHAMFPRATTAAQRAAARLVVPRTAPVTAKAGPVPFRAVPRFFSQAAGSEEAASEIILPSPVQAAGLLCLLAVPFGGYYAYDQSKWSVFGEAEAKKAREGVLGVMVAQLKLEPDEVDLRIKPEEGRAKYTPVLDEFMRSARDSFLEISGGAPIITRAQWAKHATPYGQAAAGPDGTSLAATDYPAAPSGLGDRGFLAAAGGAEKNELTFTSFCRLVATLAAARQGDTTARDALTYQLLDPVGIGELERGNLDMFLREAIDRGSLLLPTVQHLWEKSLYETAGDKEKEKEKKGRTVAQNVAMDVAAHVRPARLVECMPLPVGKAADAYDGACAKAKVLSSSK